MQQFVNELSTYVDKNRDQLLLTIQELIRLPSENRSPEGNEGACQAYIADALERSGYSTDLYEPDSVIGFPTHPLATPSRTYSERMNVAARRRGTGGGRSLILSGHVDTVPRGSLPWTRDAFGAAIEGNRMYGRGANDMKAGLGINLFLFGALSAMNIRLKGDLIFESVVDEEFGGVNGTLAGRLRGYNAEGAVLTEPSSLRICPGQRGGRTVHLLFTAGGGVLEGRRGGSVVEQITEFLASLKTFAEQRQARCLPHALYGASEDPVPVSVTKITTGPWGSGEPISIPEECRIELYWQLMPGEKKEDVDAEFLAWFESMVNRAGDLFGTRPKVSFPIRWLPGSAIDADSPLCLELKRASRMTVGKNPLVAGIEGPCDLFVFHYFGIPAVLWGPAGGNTHGSDEFVEIDTIIEAAKVLLIFICSWCGVVEGKS